MVAVAFVTSWVPWFAGALSPWLFVTAAAAPLAVGVVRVVRTHSDGPSLNGALAATARLALVFCLLLCAGVLASCGAMELTLERRCAALRGSRRRRRTACCDSRELIEVDADRRRRARRRTARRRRSSPTTASRSSGRCAALRGLPGAVGGRRAAPACRCSTPAARPTSCRRRSRRSTSRCGISPASAPAGRSASCSSEAPATAIAVNASVAADDPARPPAPPRRAVAAGYRAIKLKVGRRRRPRTRRRGARGDRPRARAAPRRQRRLDRRGGRARCSRRSAPYGLELVEEPVRGLEATQRAARARAGADRDRRDRGAAPGR